MTAAFDFLATFSLTTAALLLELDVSEVSPSSGVSVEPVTGGMDGPAFPFPLPLLRVVLEVAVSARAVTRNPLERIPNWVNSSLVNSCLELRGPTGVARILATESEYVEPLGLVIESENILSIS